MRAGADKGTLNRGQPVTKVFKFPSCIRKSFFHLNWNGTCRYTLAKENKMVTEVTRWWLLVRVHWQTNENVMLWIHYCGRSVFCVDEWKQYDVRWMGLCVCVCVCMCVCLCVCVFVCVYISLFVFCLKYNFTFDFAGACPSTTPHQPVNQLSAGSVLLLM